MLVSGATSLSGLYTPPFNFRGERPSVVLDPLFVSGEWGQGSWARFYLILQDPECRRRPLLASFTAASLGDPGVRSQSHPYDWLGWGVVISRAVSGG